MAIRVSKNELKERLYEIQEKLEVSPEELDILADVIDNDIYGLSIILISEGYIRKCKYHIEEIKNKFLKDFSNGDYDIFKKYYKKDMRTWTFLSEEQKRIIRSFDKLYKQSLKDYFINRGDLMIFRKTFNSFISSRVKNKEDIEDIKLVRNYLMNNYSYYDSLYNLGRNPEIGDDGFIKLNKLSLDSNGRLK